MIQYHIQEEPIDIDKVPYLKNFYLKHKEHIEKNRLMNTLTIWLVSWAGSALVSIGLLAAVLKITNPFLIIWTFLLLLYPFYRNFCEANGKNIRKYFEKYELFLRKISESRQNLTLEINELWKLIQKDKNLSWIDYKLIDLIKEKISIVSEQIKVHLLNFDSIIYQSQKQQFIVFPGLKAFLEEFKCYEEKELIKLWNTFKEYLKEWISYHQSELHELEKNLQIQASSTQSSDWKVALETQKLRLQSYIESINSLTE